MPTWPSGPRRCSPPRRSHLGKDSSSLSIGNSQDGGSELTGWLGVRLDLGAVFACAADRKLSPRKRASSTDLRSVIQVTTLSLCSDSPLTPPGGFPLAAASL